MELGQIGMENRPKVFIGRDNMVKNGVFYCFFFFVFVFRFAGDYPFYFFP